MPPKAKPEAINPQLKSLMMPIKDLKPDPKNARAHDERSIKAIAKSLERFGQQKPIVITKGGKVVAGNGTLKAAIMLGWANLAAVKFEDERAAKAFAIADNRTAELSSWDDPMLADLLKQSDGDGFTVAELGFTKTEYEKLLASIEGHRSGVDDDEVPALPKKAKTKKGQLYILGKHRLYCGDLANPADLEKALDGQKADMVFTSPPYNVGIKYASYDDKKTDKQYLDMVRAWMKACYNFMRPGRYIGWNVGISPKTQHFEQAIALKETGFMFRRQIIWAKPGIPKPIFQNSDRARKYIPNYQHEMIYLASKGEPEYGKETEMPEEARNDVWKISQSMATKDLPGKERKKGGMPTSKEAVHPAAFPIMLPKLAIQCLTDPGELVLDPFGGSGSTLIACERSGRRAVLVEIDPGYCDVIVDRWNRFKKANSK